MVRLTNGLKGSHIGFQKGSLINLLTYLLTYYLLLHIHVTRTRRARQVSMAAMYILQQRAYDCREEDGLVSFE